MKPLNRLAGISDDDNYVTAYSEGISACKTTEETQKFLLALALFSEQYLTSEPYIS